MKISHYTYIRILSLDVALGAGIMSVFVSNNFGLTYNGTAVAALGLGVWLIYTFDHLLDAKGLKHAAHTPRHAFHQQYFRSIVIVALCLSIVELWLLYHLPIKVFYFGLILGSFVALYFIILKLWKPLFLIAKEVMGAIIYTAGIFLISTALYQGEFSIQHYLLFVDVLLLALINLLEFAYFEYEIDEVDGHQSLIKLIGKKKARQLIHLLFIVLAVAIGFSLRANLSAFTVFIVLFMGATLALIMALSEMFAKKERYRVFGDLIFLYPLMFLLIK